MAARKTPTKPRHGHTVGREYSPTYHSWTAMRTRCRLPGRENADRYRDIGVTYSKRWESFEAFLEDMGERPPGTTLDRYPDPRGNYGPENCRWATPREQARNTRRSRLTLETATQVAVERLRGRPCQEIAEQYSISESLPREIVKGRCWPDALAAAKKIVESEND